MSRQFPALRGLAILLVVINHSITLTIESYGLAANPQIAPWLHSLLVTVQSLGLLAVPIFLFLSGAYMVYAAGGKALTAAYRSVLPSLKFVLAPYIVWSFFFYGFIWLINGESYSILGYLRNLAIGYPYNFVPILIFFYLIGPILVRFIGRAPLLTLLLIFVYQIGTANILRPSVLGFTFPDSFQLFTIPGIRLSMAVWGIFFPLGVLHGVYQDRLTNIVKGAAGWIIAAAIALFGMVLVHNLTNAEISIAQLLFPIATLLLIPVVSRERIPLFPWLERLGKKAYGLYLTNLTIISLGLFIVDQLFPLMYAAIVLLIVMLAAITIGLVSALFQVMARFPYPGVRRYLFG